MWGGLWDGDVVKVVKRFEREVEDGVRVLFDTRNLLKDVFCEWGV